MESFSLLEENNKMSLLGYVYGYHLRFNEGHDLVRVMFLRRTSKLHLCSGLVS